MVGKPALVIRAVPQAQFAGASVPCNVSGIGSNAPDRNNPPHKLYRGLNCPVPAVLSGLSGYGDGLVAAPISTYGVIMYVKYDFSNSAVYLYKHSASETPLPQAFSVSVTPTSATVQTGGTRQFTASVTGSTNTAVGWKVSAGAGSVSTSGLFTAPQAPGPGPPGCPLAGWPP